MGGVPEVDEEPEEDKTLEGLTGITHGKDDGEGSQGGDDKGKSQRETQSSARTKARGATDGGRSQDGTRSPTARGDA